MGLASVIVPCFNQLEFTRRCVTALVRYTRLPWELIVVDNGSTDGTAIYLAGVQDASPIPITVVSNPTNRGYPTAVNQGLSAALGDFLVFLDNDAVVTDGWLDQLVALTEADPGIGLTGPMSNSAVYPQLVEHIPYTDLDQMPAFAASWRDRHRGQWFNVGKLAGFCLLMKRAVYEKVRGLDESFVAGFADDDLAERARRAGFRLAVAHDLFVHHFGGRTVALGIDAQSLLDEDHARFAAKWGLPSPEVRARTRPALGRPGRDSGKGEPRRSGQPDDDCPKRGEESAGLPRIGKRAVRRDRGRRYRKHRPNASNRPRFRGEGVRVHLDQRFRRRKERGAIPRDGRLRVLAGCRRCARTGTSATICGGCSTACGLATSPPMSFVAPAIPNPAAGDKRLWTTSGCFHSVKTCAGLTASTNRSCRHYGGRISRSDGATWSCGIPATPTRPCARKLVRDEAILRTELAERPDDPFVLFNLGSIAIERQDWRPAIPLLRKSLAGSATSDSITRKLFALIARCHQMLGDSAAALQTCAQGLALDPDDAELLFRRAVVHRHRGETTEAESCWRRILTLRRPEAFCSVDQGIYGHLTRRNLASLAAERGNHAEADQLWRAVSSPNAPATARRLRSSTRPTAPKRARPCPRAVFR